MSTLSTTGSFRDTMKIGSNTNFADLPIEVTLRRFILMRRVWILNSEELTWVDKIYLKRTTTENFLDLLNEGHEWKDRIEFNNKLYDLEFINCSLEFIKEEKPKLLISIRENHNANFYCMLVRVIEDESRVPANTKEL